MITMQSAAPQRTKTHTAVTEGGSALSRYQDVMVGGRGLGITLLYELCAWLGPVPGGAGLLLRKWLWPRLLGSCGHGVLFGAGVIVRHPRRIHLGDNVVVSEGSILDARHPGADRVLVIGNDVMLANNVSVNCKFGTVRIGDRAGIGAQTIIHSIAESPVEIGADAIIGPACYLVGGSNYRLDRTDIPIREQGIRPDSGCRIGDGAWLGAGVTVLGDAAVGAGSVVAAGAVVTAPIPDYAIAAGVPARVIRQRG